jgi:hypothetical protein
MSTELIVLSRTKTGNISWKKGVDIGTPREEALRIVENSCHEEIMKRLKTRNLYITLFLKGVQFSQKREWDEYLVEYDFEAQIA